MEQNNIKELANLLKQLKPGLLPYPVFEQVARLVTLPIVEIIPLRFNSSGDVEVLLIDRGTHDPLWPNLLHTPGTVIRADDMEDGELHDHQAFRRIAHDELKDTETSAPHYIGSMFHANKRGTEQAQLYWVEVTGQPQVGEFYPTNDLPDNIIDSQYDFIGLAAKAFRDYKAPA